MKIITCSALDAARATTALALVSFAADEVKEMNEFDLIVAMLCRSLIALRSVVRSEILTTVCATCTSEPPDRV